jgi:hypothetical protein
MYKSSTDHQKKASASRSRTIQNVAEGDGGYFILGGGLC